MGQLVRSSLEPSTLKSYQSVWTNFRKFSHTILKCEVRLPVQESIIGRYVTHLYAIGLKPRTIQSHLSALAFVHKIRNLPDPTQSFFIAKLMAGISKQNPSCDGRLPITMNLLRRMLPAVRACSPTPNDAQMYVSMCLFAYYACLRVGEITITNTKSLNILKIHQLSVKRKSVTVHFERFKHSKGRTHTLEIQMVADPASCPVHQLRLYLAKRGSHQGPIFCNLDYTAVTRHQFLKILHTSLQFIGVIPKHFNTHSFRIGRCTDLVKAGHSESQI